jgi:polyisoprenoid-binding protein YceI
MASPTNLGEGLAPAYVLDAAKSRFLVKVTATGLLSAFGHSPVISIAGFTGEAWFRAQAVEQSSLRFSVDAAALSVSGVVSENDRADIERVMRDEVLEVSHYPAITFSSTGVQASELAPSMYGMRIAGKIDLHGVTRDIVIPCTATIGDETLRATGDFVIRQTDFNIRPVSVAGGTLKVKDELRFNFDLNGRRRHDPTQ